jgi:predicted glutamine amidotransferase
MIGVLSAAPVSLRALLADAPRSLAALSAEHRDGWGVAWRTDGDWTVRKGTACAAECDAFLRAANDARSALAIAHVRKKTVGPLALANTHPFRRGRWILAHNGTLEDVPSVSSLCSAARLAEIEGDTDSERLFALLMTSIDASGDVARGLDDAIAALRSLARAGTASFLLSDGERLWAHRSGRPLFLLDRTAATGRRTPSIAIASERLTDERWCEIEEGGLFVVGPASKRSNARIEVASASSRGRPRRVA